MSRRLAGALLLLAVGLTVVIVPSVSGVRVAGFPIPAALPAPPRVGDCLLNAGLVVSMKDRGPYPGRASHLAGREASSRIDAVFGPCGSTATAEVVAVSTVVGGATDRPRIVAANGDECRDEALRYAGLVSRDAIHTLPDAPDDEPIAWNFSIDVGTQWKIPTRSLRAAGANWAACVVTGPVGTGHRGSIRNAFAGPLPSGLGTCWSSDHLSAGVRYVNCETGHRSELIATGFLVGPDMITFDAVVQSCGRIAARAIDRVDPTASGGLRLNISPDVSMWNRANRRSSSAVCYLTSTSDRLIAGSLIGLGERALRWAG